MSSTPTRRSLLETTALAGFDPVILEFIDDLRHRGGAAEGQLPKYRYAARHFLIWLELAGIELKMVDGTVIEHFLQHDCRCAESSAPVRLRRWRKCRTSSRVMTFIRFLERTGRIETPGELDDNFRLLGAFLAGLRRDGHATATIELYRYGCGGLIVWLHLSRLRLCDLSPEVIARFRRRQIVCSIPGVFYGHESRCPATAYETELRGFLKHLVSIGRIEPLEQNPDEKTPPPRLERFADWLERHRAISPESIRQQVRLIAEMLPGLGDDPGVYDAALIRRVLFDRMESWSQSYARRLTTAMRMYLRFLVSEGSIAAELVEAVPTVPQWRLSALPRYIPADDVERTGMRIGEALALTMDDVTADGLVIRDTKFGKTRMVALHPTTWDALNRYLGSRLEEKTPDPHLFVIASGLCPSRGYAEAVFRRLAEQAGIREPGAARGPTPHSLRHSFAVRSLESLAPGIDPSRHMLALATYLGHVDVSSTYWYLESTPALLRGIAEAAEEAHANGGSDD